MEIPAQFRMEINNLVEMGAFNRTGERRHTRYWLHLRSANTTALRIGERFGE